MTIEKATKEFGWMLEETLNEEAAVNASQRLLGDACGELRRAHGLTCEAVAKQMRLAVGCIVAFERRATTAQAKRYRLACLAASTHGTP